MGRLLGAVPRRDLRELAERVLQLFTFVLLTADLIHRNSAESADGDDELKAMLQELLDRTPGPDPEVRQPEDVRPA